MPLPKETEIPLCQVSQLAPLCYNVEGDILDLLLSASPFEVHMNHVLIELLKSQPMQASVE